jgi:hypothetical protein
MAHGALEFVLSRACIRQDMIYAFLTAEDTDTQFARECLRCLALFSFLSKVHTGMS